MTTQKGSGEGQEGAGSKDGDEDQSSTSDGSSSTQSSGGQDEPVAEDETAAMAKAMLEVVDLQGDMNYARLIDMDGDGVQELLIGPIKADEFYEKMIFSLYTLDENGVNKLVFDGTERNRYYYAGENRFANLGSSAFNDSFETTVKLEDGEMIDMTYTTAPADYVQMELTPFSQWVK